jgi:hemerythrin superfamily protein
VDALELLEHDHRTVEALFDRFKTAKEEQDTQGMADTAQRIFAELEVHTAVEEEIFYPESQKVGGEAEELVAEGIQEHHVVKVLMDEIRALRPGQEEWEAKLTVLIENVEHHVEEEETELFPQLREAFGQDRLDRMGEAMMQAKQRHQLDGATRDELYAQAKTLGVEGRSNMTKDELARAVKQRRAS